jgi:KDO2-lipid IV(A) lauroyltransferase
MGALIPAGPAAPIRMMEALDEGLHLGMLVDQRFGRGPKIRFLGREATAIPIPRPSGAALRLPDPRRPRHPPARRPLPAGADGGGWTSCATQRGRWTSRGATQQVNDIVEGWIREHPGQWLWQHRRWRM